MSTEEPDPERLLAEALRAQAVRAPMPASPQVPPPEHLLRLLSGTESGYGLLAGHEPTVRGAATRYQSENTQATGYAGGTAATTQVRRRPRPLAVGWIVLIALLLGLLAGGAVGVLTMV
jgi:hypothetical protein